jgi:hypothetical protein
MKIVIFAGGDTFVAAFTKKSQTVERSPEIYLRCNTVADSSQRDPEIPTSQPAKVSRLDRGSASEIPQENIVEPEMRD